MHRNQFGDFMCVQPYEIIPELDKKSLMVALFSAVHCGRIPDVGQNGTDEKDFTILVISNIITDKPLAPAPVHKHNFVFGMEVPVEFQYREADFFDLE
ncbi:MAG: hypothetical protein P8184_06870 [Calditrichia bacterium]